MSVNLVILQGNMGKDPELRRFTDGTAVVNFSLATNEVWRDKEGERQEHTEWHNCVARGRTAEVLAEYVRKGDPLFLEGRNKTRKYEKEGVEVRVTEVIISKLTLMGGRNAGKSAGDDQDGDGISPERL